MGQLKLSLRYCQMPLLHFPPALLEQAGELGCSTLSLPYQNRQGKVVMALSCCLAETKGCGGSSHSPTPWLESDSLINEGILLHSLQSLQVPAVKTFACCFAEDSKYAHPLHSPAASLKQSGAIKSTQKVPLDHLALVVKGLLGST